MSGTATGTSRVPTTTRDPFFYGWRYVEQEGPSGGKHLAQVPLSRQDVLHPREGDFIVNTEAHHRDREYLKAALRLAINGRAGWQVLGDMRVDWGVEGVRAHGPDLVVFEGVNQAWDLRQGTFRVADFPARPVLVIEVTSPSTRTVDMNEKVVEYHRAGVPFYLIVDHEPTDEDSGRLAVGLIAYRSIPEGYVRVADDEKCGVLLPLIGLRVVVEGDRVVAFNPDGSRVPEVPEMGRGMKQLAEKLEEVQALAEEAITARKDSDRRLERAEARIADLEAELKRLRTEP